MSKSKIGSYFRELINFKGDQSSGRFGFLLSVIMSNVAVWYTWIFICMWTKTMINIPDGVWMTYAIANGVAFAGKGVQAFAEKTEEKKKETE